MTFDAATSWSTFDVTAVSPRATAFMGSAFDGRYVYLVPGVGGGDGGGMMPGLVLRCDTLADFTAASSWSKFDTSALGSEGPYAFAGAVFDGRYLYLVPWLDATGYSGTVARFDAKTPPSMPKLPSFFGSFL